MQTDELYLDCVRFLNREAELLDNRQFRAWLDLLAGEIDYRVPVRVTPDLQSGASPFSDDAFHMVEDWGSLKTRVARFETDYAWSENPPSRTRRFVSNVRVDASRPDK